MSGRNKMKQQQQQQQQTVLLVYEACQGIANASPVLQRTVFSSSYTENQVTVVPTLLSFVAPLVVMTTVCGAANDDKVVAFGTRGFQCVNQQSVGVLLCLESSRSFNMSWELPRVA